MQQNQCVCPRDCRPAVGCFFALLVSSGSRLGDVHLSVFCFNSCWGRLHGTPPPHVFRVCVMLTILAEDGLGFMWCGKTEKTVIFGVN